MPSFVIKVPAPRTTAGQQWGDTHFARALRDAFLRAGHACELRFREDWYSAQPDPDEVVLALRGLERYFPCRGQINLMWHISHPDAVSDTEYETFDHVFVASDLHAAAIGTRLAVPVTPLLQATDPARFHPDAAAGPASRVLFVGNSRDVYRQIVRDAVLAGLQPTLHGRNWDKFVGADAVTSNYVPNEELPGHYVAAGVVLSDQWDDMCVAGFLPNRLFDAAACGCRVVSTSVAGLELVFGDRVQVYDGTPAGLRQYVQSLLDEPPAAARRRREQAGDFALRHSFDARIAAILQAVGHLQAQRAHRAGQPLA